MLTLAVVSFVGALALPATGLVGAAFVPEMDQSMFVIDFRTPPGSNLAYTRAKATEAARIARKQPEVTSTYTSVSTQDIAAPRKQPPRALISMISRRAASARASSVSRVSFMKSSR